MRIKIMVVDDHDIVREGIKKIVEKHAGFSVAAEVRTGKEAVDRVRREKFDAIILDITLPDTSGLAVLQDLRKLPNQIPILVLSMHAEEEYAVGALKLGASGYLTKESAARELIPALEKICGGGKYITPAVAELFASEMETSDRKRRHPVLSDREVEVLGFLASGKTIKEIAYDLGLSDKTVRVHRTNILHKMRMKNDVELTHYAIVTGLLKV